MSNAVATMQLPIIGNLFDQKQKELKQLAGNLQIDEVKEDIRFEAAIKRIKRQLLLTPVTIGEPKITNHYQTTRDMPPSYHNMWGGPQEIFKITVNFPFSGGTELLSYMPGNVSIPMGRVYQTYGSSIEVEVTLAKLDKAETLATAKEDMRTTQAVAEANNQQAAQWAASFELLIDSTLIDRRKELLDFYS